MDEIRVLREAFGYDELPSQADEVPSQAAENRARTALRQRMTAGEQAMTAGRRYRRRGTPSGTTRFASTRFGTARFGITAGVAVAAAVAVIAGVAVYRAGGLDQATPPRAGGPGAAASTTGASSTGGSAVLPFARPVSAAQYLENAAWTAERKPWTDPRPDQFMYIDTLQLRNTPAYENQHPNAPIRPGLGQNRRFQEWYSIDGQTSARYDNGNLVVTRRDPGDESFAVRIPWSTITAMDSPEKVKDFVPGPASMSVALDAFIGQYVVPPNVQAAIFRHLAQEPGMRVNPDAVNIDGHPAIGLGRILEGYLSQELLFDKQTYALIGERLVAIKDHVTHGDDVDLVSHKGDVFRQVIYAKMIIVDRAGDTE